MAHSHAHGNDNNYVMDQIFTVLVSGALAIVAIMMHQDGTLEKILQKSFWPFVLGGGIVVMLLVVIRAASLWQAAKAEPVPAEHCDHPSHGHEHSHDESEHHHSHNHSHSHSHSHAHSAVEEDEEDHHDHNWAPWRYMVLAVPIFLYLLGFPKGGYSEKRLAMQLGNAEFGNVRVPLSSVVGGIAWTKAMPNRGEINLKFPELADAAPRKTMRENYTDRVGTISGQFWPQGDKQFTLYYLKMTCCRADVVPVKVTIVAPETLQGAQKSEWVRVKGVISFQQSEGEWIPIITVEDMNDIVTGVEPVNYD
ncbi:MAG: hypothetical protein R3B84_06215 [Zavarzinella sp.]